MTKAELIETVARATHLEKKTAARAIELTFDHIARAIRKDKRFWVPGFGTFSVRRRRPRAGLQPAHAESDDDSGRAHRRFPPRAETQERACSRKETVDRPTAAGAQSRHCFCRLIRDRRLATTRPVSRPSWPRALRRERSR